MTGLGLVAEFCLGIVELLTAISLEVGSYFHLSSEAIGAKGVRWLFDIYEMVQKAKYQREMSQVYGTELAVLRALVQFHSKRHRRLPKLPTYEQSVAAEERTVRPVRQEKPAWMQRYEKVNRERMLAKKGKD